MIPEINMRFTKLNTGLVVFLSFSILLLVHVIFTFAGFYGNDDINYAGYAAHLVNERTLSLGTPSHYALRWSCIYVTALFYSVFGINEITSSLFSFSCLTGTAFIIYRMLARQSVSLLFYACLLFFLSFMTLFYAHRLLPDAGICLFVFLAYYFYHQKKFEGRSDGLMAAGFSASLFLAVLTKESIVITLPLWIYFIASDLWRRQRRVFWVYSGTFSALLISGYLIYWKITTGDWLFRYHALLDNHLQGGGLTYQAMGFYALIKRLSFELWHVFLLSGDFEYLLFGIGAFIYRRSVFETDGQRHFSISFLILLLCANFMTYSIDGYNPLLPDPRHYMFLLPFAAVSGAFMIKAYLAQPEKYTGLIWMFVAADVFLLLSDIGYTKYIYFFITALLLLYWIAHRYKRGFFPGRLMIAGLMMILGLNYINDFVNPRYPYYFDQKRLVQAFADECSAGTIVVGGDDMTAELSPFMLGYENNNIRFFSPLDEIPVEENDIDRYLLINGDYDIRFNNPSNSLLEQFNLSEADIVYRENNVILYKLRKGMQHKGRESQQTTTKEL